jgi:hypothetical protein
VEVAQPDTTAAHDRHERERSAIAGVTAPCAVPQFGGDLQEGCNYNACCDGDMMSWASARQQFNDRYQAVDPDLEEKGGKRRGAGRRPLFRGPPFGGGGNPRAHPVSAPCSLRQLGLLARLRQAHVGEDAVCVSWGGGDPGYLRYFLGGPFLSFLNIHRSLDS